jgi:hypothetical protein
MMLKLGFAIVAADCLLLYIFGIAAESFTVIGETLR